MALKRLTIDGYGQVELNNVAFRRDGRVEAQCKLKKDEFSKTNPAENGMILAVNKIKNIIGSPIGMGDIYPVALNYSAEHLCDERNTGLKNFYLTPDSYLPRVGYLSVGDTFTTNCVCYDDVEFESEEALKTALENVETSVFGVVDNSGVIKLTKTKPETIPHGLLMMAKSSTMPDGQYGVHFHVVAV